jgi:hypothetical protein
MSTEPRQDNFIKIRNGEKIIITFEDFRKKYRCYFDKARSPDLTIRKSYNELPSSLEGQTFIRQLVNIGDIEPTNIEYMAKYTHFLLTVQSNLTNWQQEGELTNEEIEDFHSEAKLRWDNKFRSVYRSKSKNYRRLAFEVVDKMREEKLKIGTQQVDTAFSNGEYYFLSNIPEIGWEYDWESKYK